MLILNIKINKKIENVQKTLSLIKFLSIVEKYPNGLFYNAFMKKFILKDIQKVKTFRDYESVDEYLFDIFEGLNYKPTIIEKDKLNLIIKVPLHTRRFPEINYPLNIKNQKDKEIKELKEKMIKKIRNLYMKNLKAVSFKYLMLEKIYIIIIFLIKVNLMKILLE